MDFKFCDSFNMCLFRRPKLPKRAPSQVSPPASASAMNLKNRKVEDDSGFDLSASSMISPSELSKESKGSGGTQDSVSSALSLASLKGMLSDGARFFTYKDILKATKNFSPDNNLGGTTFRGTIAGKDVTVVVEKRTHVDVDFVAEVRSICNLHHSSLVRLIGGCMSGDQSYLVFEYSNGANLRQCLGSSLAPDVAILTSWTERLRVALEIAKGIEYLHEHTSPPSVHKYIKSTSIILDNELHARIANVGIARIRGETASEPDSPSVNEKKQLDENPSSERQERGAPGGRALRLLVGRPRSIKITGTHGYMAPEYAHNGVVTPKLDVYAFGVVLLEILSGQEAVKVQRSPTENVLKKTVLPEVIAAIFSDDDPRARVRAWIDPVLRDKFSLDCAYRAALVAKNCVEKNPDNRPIMRNVTLNLEQIYSASKQWADHTLAAKNLLTSSFNGR